MKIIALLALTITFVLADDVKMPADVQKALEAYNAAVIKASVEYIGKLEKAKIAATKAGNLDLANALNEKIKEKKGKADTNLLADADDLKKKIVGKWKCWGNFYEINMDGTAFFTFVNGTKEKGTYTIDEKTGTCHFTWSKRGTDKIIIPTNENLDNTTVTDVNNNLCPATRVIETTQPFVRAK